MYLEGDDRGVETLGRPGQDELQRRGYGGGNGGIRKIAVMGYVRIRALK